VLRLPGSWQSLSGTSQWSLLTPASGVAPGPDLSAQELLWRTAHQPIGSFDPDIGNWGIMPPPMAAWSRDPWALPGADPWAAAAQAAHAHDQRAFGPEAPAGQLASAPLPKAAPAHPLANLTLPELVQDARPPSQRRVTALGEEARIMLADPMAPFRGETTGAGSPWQFTMTQRPPHEPPRPKAGPEHMTIATPPQTPRGRSPRRWREGMLSHTFSIPGTQFQTPMTVTSVEDTEQRLEDATRIATPEGTPIPTTPGLTVPWRYREPIWTVLCAWNRCEEPSVWERAATASVKLF
jgi:hypothetical protein